MSSKEALKNLYQGALNPVNCVYATFRTGASEKITDDYNIVKKDLEVLEILKDKKVNIPYLHSLFEQADDETIVWYYNLGLEKEEPRMKKITIDDFYKIKEWLENVES